MQPLTTGLIATLSNKGLLLTMKLFVNNLSVLDFSYIDIERGVVGESLIASLALSGTTDQQGMICDFGVVKKRAKQWLDNTVDHTLVVPSRQPGLTAHTLNDITTIEWKDAKGRNYKCQGPAQAFTLVDQESITPCHIAMAAKQGLQDLLNTPGIKDIDLSLSNETINSPYYHYTHGLKKHQGQCQRIAHGHRSRIEIWQNNQRRHDIEQVWAQTWQDIYLGSEEDIVDRRQGEDHVDYYHFQYQSQEGHYVLSLPADNCYIMASDTTVELIAQHIATKLKAQYPSEAFTVRAFEGVDKGASMCTEDL